MPDEILTQGRWKLRAHGQQKLFVRGRSERSTHVIMKAYLWALYLPAYPNMSVEVGIGDRYKPDVIAMNEDSSKPAFWGESARVSPEKIAALVKRYRDTHFAIAKWGMRLDPTLKMVQAALKGVRRAAPFDVLNFDKDATCFIQPDGSITLSHDDIEWIRLEP